MLKIFKKKWRKYFVSFLIFTLFLFLVGFGVIQAAFECPAPSTACYGRRNENSGDFTARAFDPDGDNIYYTFFWGDASQSRCPAAGFVPSGTPCAVSHAWANPGIYNIYVRATDVNGNTSPDSNIVVVYISNLRNFTKNVDKTTAGAGEQLNYTFSFDITDARTYKLMVTDAIPANSVYINGSARYVCPSGLGPGTRVGADIIWNLGQQATGTCNLQMSVTAQPGLIIDTAEAFARNADTIPSNSVSTAVLDSWYQTSWGDVHSDGDIANEEPSGENSASYMVTAGGSINDFTSGEGSDWEHSGYRELDAVFSRVDINGLIAGDYGEVRNTVPANWLGSDNPLITKPLWWTDDPDRNVWYRDGNLGIAINNQDLYLERAGTIVVDGDLRVRHNVYYDPNFDCASVPVGVDCRKALPVVGYVVTGDVYIDDDVTEVAGVFYVLGSFNTGTTDLDQLVIQGSVYASDLNLGRAYVTGGDPAEFVRFDGRALVNPPPGFLDTGEGLPRWYEVKP